MKQSSWDVCSVIEKPRGHAHNDRLVFAGDFFRELIGRDRLGSGNLLCRSGWSCLLRGGTGSRGARRASENVFGEQCKDSSQNRERGRETSISVTSHGSHLRTMGDWPPQKNRRAPKARRLGNCANPGDRDYELGVMFAFFCLMALTLSIRSSAVCRSWLRASAVVSMSAFCRYRRFR